MPYLSCGVDESLCQGSVTRRFLLSALLHLHSLHLYSHFHCLLPLSHLSLCWTLLLKSIILSFYLPLLIYCVVERVPNITESPKAIIMCVFYAARLFLFNPPHTTATYMCIHRFREHRVFYFPDIF